MNPIRTVIVDDEPGSRERVRELLEDRADFEVVGECAAGQEAIDVLRRTAPDLVFLDVEMPGPDGFEVLGALEPDGPAVVFVTAFEDYAVRAFDVKAVDYLVKPFDDRRFERALSRAREQLRNRRTAEVRKRLWSLARELELEEDEPPAAPPDPPTRHMDRILLKGDDSRTFFMKVDQIDWIEAAAYYARIHVEGEHFMVRISLNKLEDRLDPRTFVRVHRSAIVNLDRVRELQPWMNGAYLVILEDGTQIRMSRARRESLADLFGRSP